MLIPWVRERAHRLRVRERVCALENAWESYSGFRVWSRVTGRRTRRRRREGELYEVEEEKEATSEWYGIV